MERIKERIATQKFKKNPGFIHHLRISREIGFVQTHRQIGYKFKISGKGKVAFFVGYTTEHAGDVYRMYNPNTKGIKISRDIRWMGKFYNDGDPIEIPDYKENNSRNMKSIPPPIRYDDAEKESNFMKQSLNEKNIPENPAINNVAEVVLVGGTDESYESLERFNDAWYNENPKLRLKWREVIKKEFENMEKNHVWRVIKKTEVQENRRLLGAKWVFKVKKNGIFKARLVAQGFSQIPGVDHQDSFSLVIYDTTFRIILVMWIKYGWEAEIIDIETAFLFGNLEEEIY